MNVYFLKLYPLFSEIIMRVRNHEVPPYRPHIPDDSNVPDKAVFLMRCCWHEHSESRPDFHSIRKRLIDINSGRYCYTSEYTCTLKFQFYT